MSRSVPSFVAGVVFGLSLSASVAFAGGPFDSVLRSLRGAADEATQIQTIAYQVRDPYVRDQLVQSSGRLTQRLADARGALRNEAAPPAPRGPVATPEFDFGQVLGAMSREPFSDDKFAVLRDASRGRFFTTDQVIRLMEQFPFSSYKVDAAAMLYPQVVDPWNWYNAYSALTFSSDKATLRSRTGG